MTLEEFIVTNHDKALPSSVGAVTFKYDMVLISVRSYDGSVFEATLAYPAPEFVTWRRFDASKFTSEELTSLYRWLRDEFFPAAEENLNKCLLKKKNSKT